MEQVWLRECRLGLSLATGQHERNLTQLTEAGMELQRAVKGLAAVLVSSEGELGDQGSTQRRARHCPVEPRAVRQATCNKRDCLFRLLRQA